MTTLHPDDGPVFKSAVEFVDKEHKRRDEKAANGNRELWTDELVWALSRELYRLAQQIDWLKQQLNEVKP